MAQQLQLSFGFCFDDLYQREGLVRLDQTFSTYLLEHDLELSERYQAARKNCATLEALTESTLILEVAPLLEDFISILFKSQKNVVDLQTLHHELAPLFSVKRFFVQRVALRKHPKSEADKLDGAQIGLQLQKELGELTDLNFAHAVSQWLEDEAQFTDTLDLAAQYSAWATLTTEGQKKHKGSVLFQAPKKLDPHHLIDVEIQENGAWGLHEDHHRSRCGFQLTDGGFTREKALAEATYCIWCHHQGKDSCSKGLKPKSPDAEDRFQKNTFGTALTGCPLEQKISEMNEMKTMGYSIGALGIVIIDNPMVAATGHRICNDCMKACIYQKQDPVNIPGTETQILRDVLGLPWGVEIYSLLTRWNPLNLRRPLPEPDLGYKVLVVGMGPAGFTLAHHLMNDGHTVVGIDGLKIEPLPSELSGVDLQGNRVPFQPIQFLDILNEPLDRRVNWGFGGVAEYGITVRWDKNYLKLIRLLLERRSQFALFGGIRFGGTLTIDQAFSMGFDHIALCMGAGSPTLIPMKNGLAPGIRQASDFLMALQLTGAAKESSLANLQLRLPVVVIGGGLTAIDTATEAMAYYPLQVMKFARRYDQLGSIVWTEEEQLIVDEFLQHAKLFEAEKEAAKTEHRTADYTKTVQVLGGVTIAYRRALTDSPSYTLNHEEVEKALEEGITILDHASPVRVSVDSFGHAEALVVNHQGNEKDLPARSIIIAAGTKPNTNLRYDDPMNIALDGLTFQAVDEGGQRVMPERSPKPVTPNVLMQVRADQKAMSFFGDLHPSFAGNVVKAMGSAKQGFPAVTEVLKKAKPSNIASQALIRQLNQDLRPVVHAVNRLTPTILEIVVKAPLAARAFHPGQFYRLQNFEVLAPKVEGVSFTMEGLALTGASVDREAGLISLIVLEFGGSSNLCQFLKPGEPIVLMGPTGTPTEIPANETVLLVGGGLGNAVLYSMGQALRQKGSKVIYVAGYKQLQNRYKVEEIEAAADQIVWCCDEAPGFTPTRPQDRTYVGNIVEALADFGQGGALKSVDRMIVIGSDVMMAAVAKARQGILKDVLNPCHVAIGSINSPMQCMMKGICAQCLQRHINPETGEETIVYSCVNQDQRLEEVDFSCLADRLKQNSIQEKLTSLWVKELM